VPTTSSVRSWQTRSRFGDDGIDAVEDEVCTRIGREIGASCSFVFIPLRWTSEVLLGPRAGLGRRWGISTFLA
jgi:hypothetical protein